MCLVERPFVSKIIGVLLRTLRHKDGLLSEEGFINITDGKNFVRAAQKHDRSFLKRKVISPAEGI